jgi:pseudomonalisin
MSSAAASVRLWSVTVLALFLAGAGRLPPLGAQVSGRLRVGGRVDRVVGGADLVERQRLRGHLPGWVRSENVSSQVVDLTALMRVSLVLSRGEGFERLLAEQQDPGSALYHQWLTPEQVGAMFGPSEHDLQVVERWAEAQGLTVTGVAPSLMSIELAGTTAAVGNAFRTEFAWFSHGGARYLAAMAEPSIPSALAPVIASVRGLVRLPLHPQVQAVARVRPAASGGPSSGVRPELSLSNGAHFVTPSDFATIYDLQSVYSGGNTGATVGGKPQHIAVIGRSRVANTDISQFASTTGIGSYAFNTVLASAVDPGTTANGDQVEATLDVERTIGTAPGAQTDLVISGTVNGEDGVYVAASYNVNILLDPVMTISFGACEASVGAAGVNAWNTLFSTAAAEGITVLIPSGDAGVAECDVPLSASPVTQVSSINAICASSYATCVGGTEFSDTVNTSLYWSSTNRTGYGSALSYIPEGAWNEPSMTSSAGAVTYAPSATGGGPSQYVAKPSWQVGTGVPADGQRDVPDVSFAASGHDGYYGCLAFAGGDCSQNQFEYFFGTSTSAPSMAGVAALWNTASGAAQGNLNPLLYRAATNASAGAFHDVTIATSGVGICTSAIPSVCNNSTPGAGGLSGGLAGYVLTTGYDEVTGLGSPDVARLFAAAPSFTLQASPSTLSLSGGGSSTVTVTVSSVNGFAGLVSLSCTGSTTQSACGVTPGSVTLTAGGLANATVTISSTGGHARGSGGMPLSVMGGGGAALLAFVFCCPPLRRRRRMVSLAMLVFGSACVAGLGGCGSGTASGGSPTSYTITVTGTSAAGSASIVQTTSASVRVTLN